MTEGRHAADGKPSCIADDVRARFFNGAATQFAKRLDVNFLIPRG